MMQYSEEDKLKYVRGFRNCTLTMYDYADKMGIPGDEFRGWLQKYKELPAFGMIKVNIEKEEDNEAIRKETVSEVRLEQTRSTKQKTIMNFDNGTIRLELKETFNKELLKSLVEALVQC